MNYRSFLVSISCFAVAAGLGSGEAVRAGDLQPANDSVFGDVVMRDSAASPGVPCALGGARGGQPGGCERIGGRVRIDAISRIPDPPRFGGGMASPVAVRTGDGTGSRGHLYLPGSLDDLGPVRR